MAHINFAGDIRRHPALRSLFWQWGVTVGKRPAGRPATVEECDAVVLVHRMDDPEQQDSGAMPGGADTGGAAAFEAAPLLVIGTAPAALEPWVVIPDAGPGGCHLQVALQSCRERAQMLRGDSCSSRDQDQFRDFLGHELRSPLTAIKTALTVLEAEVDGRSGLERMLGIALRNLDRLSETVEWSQELMSLSRTPPNADLGPVSLASLAGELPGHLDLCLDECDEALEIITDPRLLGLLAGQMERVLAFASPGKVPVFRWVADPGNRECRLSARVSVTPPEAFSVQPGALDASYDPRSGWNGNGLHHLVRMLVSPQLLQVLGVKVSVRADSPGEMEISACWPSRLGASSQPDPVFIF